MKYLLLILIVFITSRIYSQIPAGYYGNASDKSGYDLKTTLHLIIKANYSTQTYASLWNHFLSTDAKSNGKVWDIYSDDPEGNSPYEYTFITDQCGNYNQEGICYNREHSFPQSWFGSDLPMSSDIFHIYPTDGYVNGLRNNYPYGEVSSPTNISKNGSKLGPNATAGYDGIVFEPIDEYKGDLARSYFYMATRYEDVITEWENLSSLGTDVLNGTANQVFEQWFLNLLIKWNKQDVVSQKEIDRNNAIYQIQNNRNPFIDHPFMVECIWLNDCENPDGIPDLELSPNIDIYQNRDERSIIATWDLPVITSLKIYDLSGRLILHLPEVVSGEKLIHSKLNDGFYIFEFVFPNKYQSIHKVLL